MENNKVDISQIEKTIIQMIASEMPNKQIAKELNYSQRMIEYYIKNISEKLNAQTRVGIIVRAFQNELIS